MKMPFCAYGDDFILPVSNYSMYCSVKVGSIEPYSKGVKPVEVSWDGRWKLLP